MAKRTSVLVTVSGKDKPGITSELTGVLAKCQVNILDVAQAVIHGLLSLSFLFEINDENECERPVLAQLNSKAKRLGLEIDSKQVDPAGARGSATTSHYAVTLIADRVSASALHRVTAVLAEYKLNIDVIKKLSEDQFGCVELIVSTNGSLDASLLKKELLSIAKKEEVDIALQAEGLYRRAKRLVVMDMDSTLIQAEVIDELAREKGVYDEVSAITHRAMSGKIDYDESLRLRVEMLKGLTVEELDRVYRRVPLTPGARDLIQVLKKLGYKVALISGGFTFVADRLKLELGIDFAYANTLDIKDGAVTGKVIPPIVNAQRKADLLDVIAQQEKIELDQVVAIGDGANDLLMLEKAGLGIAFNAKATVREKADTAVSQKNMRSILYLLGISGRDLAELRML